MRLLIIGGTRFLGRALVDAALDAGYTVTLFNRGQTNPDLYPQLETLTGDRDGGLDVLRGRRWDAVIDTCGYVPRLVRDSATLLADAVELYTFISTLSVYADPSVVGVDEDAPLATVEDEAAEEVTGDTYGGLKVLCENAAMEVMNGRALLVRPGLIVGPHDPTDRFTYWPVRVDRGGEVLAPGPFDAAVQIVDARDLAAWTLDATAQRLTGPYNVTGPAETLTMADVLRTCHEVAGSEAEFTWVSEEFLLENEVAPYSEMPLWVPSNLAGFNAFDISKALDAGLTFRPLTDTVRDTLAWAVVRPDDYTLRAGMPPEREAELLRKWRARGTAA